MTPGRPLSEIATVRPSRSSDLAAVDALMARAFPKLLRQDYAPSVMVTAVPLIARAQPALLGSGSYYVAEGRDGRILGAGGWTARNPQSGRIAPDRASIRHFATDPDALRQGIAAAIMAQCLAEAARAGVRVMDCLSTATAVPFYRAQGFVERGPVEVALRAGVVFPAVAMDRALAAP